MAKLVLLHFAVLPLLLALQGCFMFDTKLLDDQIRVLTVSNELDRSLWSASPWEDMDHDGVPDLLLKATVDYPTLTPARAWILSGRDLEPIVCIVSSGTDTDETLLQGIVLGRRYTGRSALAAAPLRGPSFLYDDSGAESPDWYAVDPDLEFHAVHSEVSCTESPLSLNGSASFLLVDLKWKGEEIFAPEHQGVGPALANGPPAGGAFLTKYPDAHDMRRCGDVDGDGALDWLAVTTGPPSVIVVSGGDTTILRSIPLQPDGFATVATGGFLLGDVDGDGVEDWILGCQVSQSTDRLTPRSCDLGVMSLLSGADWHLIRSLERDQFINGAGARCRTVSMPD